MMIDFKNGTFAKLRRVDNDDIGSVPEKLLLPDESVVGVYKSVRDRVIFTDRRVIAVNIQGATGKKQDITSMPYRKIDLFSVETSGFFDVDSELELYFGDTGRVRFEFFGTSNILEIGQVLAQYCL